MRKKVLEKSSHIPAMYSPPSVFFYIILTTFFFGLENPSLCKDFKLG